MEQYTGIPLLEHDADPFKEDDIDAYLGIQKALREGCFVRAYLGEDDLRVVEIYEPTADGQTNLVARSQKAHLQQAFDNAGEEYAGDYGGHDDEDDDEDGADWAWHSGDGFLFKQHGDILVYMEDGHFVLRKRGEFEGRVVGVVPYRAASLAELFRIAF